MTTIIPLENKSIVNNQQEHRTLSDLIVEYLELLGIEYVFGIPGGHNSPLYEALARSEKRGGPRAILTSHETGAAFMADGYARETGKIGVCCATTGPGTTNLITGIASAYAECTPLLVITAQTILSHFGWGAFQESSPDTIDTVAMLKHCTRYNSLVTHANQLERKLFTALKTAFGSPKGPVHLSIPVDISRVPAPELTTYPNLSELITQPTSFLNLAALENLWQTLYKVLIQGRKVVLLVGKDSGGGVTEIIRFAELINALILTTQSGKSCIDPYNPLARGVFGFAGHKTARQALTDESVDLILAVGATLGQWETSVWDKAILNNKLVHIHNSDIYFARSSMAQLQIQGDIKTIFKELISRLETMQSNGKLDLNSKLLFPPRNHDQKLQDYPSQIEVLEPESYQNTDTKVCVKPQQLISALLRNLPPETRFQVDIGNWLSWSIHYLFPPCPENYRLAIETAAMGWGIGSAVGTALGVKNTPVVCLTGDGCFLMHGNELAVAVVEKLPIIFVILNDKCYGMVKHRHRQTGKEPLEFTLPTVDFSLMAKAMGANSYIIRHAQDLEKLNFEAIYSYPGPTVLDVHIDSEEIPPMGMY